MNAITPFIFEDLMVRTIIRLAEPWFHAADVCRCLEIKNPRDAIKRLDDDEVVGVGSTDASPGSDNNYVSEAGLFGLILGSRKPSARRFKRWVTHDVLPALRKTGVYRMAGRENERPADPYDITAEALPVWQTKLSAVREARHLFGHERARALWSKLGLFDLPLQHATGKGEAMDLLQLLLFGKLNDKSLRQHIEDQLENGTRDGRETLKQQTGVWVEPQRDGFVLANRHPWIERVLEGTTWSNGQWHWTLRRLPGVSAAPQRQWTKGGQCAGLVHSLRLSRFRRV